MGQASGRKKILQPISALGIEKISNIEDALENAFGKERAVQITEEWERLAEEADRSDFPGNQNALYEFLNQDYELSLLVSCYTDAAIIREFGLWLYDIRASFGKTILDVGCGNGILSCFLAAMLPAARITAIDRCENSIRIANQIKEKMGVSNIEFQTIALKEMEKDCFDTVLSLRTFHENIGIRKTEIRFRSFQEQLAAYRAIYHSCIKALCAPVSENGMLICLERNQMDTEYLSILQELNAEGLRICPKSMKELSCAESDFKKPSVFQALIAEKNSRDHQPAMTEDELFALWKDRAFSRSKEPEYFTRAQSDWYMEQYADGLIEGYATYDAKGTQLARACLMRLKDHEEQFLLYQANYGKAGLQILPLEALDEAKELLKEHRLVDAARGFEVREDAL